MAKGKGSKKLPKSTTKVPLPRKGGAPMPKKGSKGGY